MKTVVENKERNLKKRLCRAQMISIIVWVLYEGRGRGKEVAALMVVAVGRISRKFQQCASQLKLRWKLNTLPNTTQKNHETSVAQLSSTSPLIVSSTSNPNHLPHSLTAVSVNPVPMLFHQCQATRHVAAKLPHHKHFRTLTTVNVYWGTQGSVFILFFSFFSSY